MKLHVSSGCQKCAFMKLQPSTQCLIGMWPYLEIFLKNKKHIKHRGKKVGDSGEEDWLGCLAFLRTHFFGRRCPFLYFLKKLLSVVIQSDCTFFSPIAVTVHLTHNFFLIRWINLSEPVGKFHVQVCTTTPCMVRGAYKVFEHLKQKLGTTTTFVAFSASQLWATDLKLIASVIHA